MKNKYYVVIILILILLLSSCNNGKTEESSSNIVENSSSEQSLKDENISEKSANEGQQNCSLKTEEIEKIVSCYNEFSKLSDIEFENKIPLNWALNYFIINQLDYPYDDYKDYIYSENKNELVYFKLPENLVENYILKYFNEINFDDKNNLNEYKNGFYFLPNSGIGSPPMTRYDIENVKEEKDTITFNCNTVFYGDGVDVLLKTQKFTLIKKNDNYVIKSIKITFKKEN